MQRQDYAILHAVEANYWWFVGMRRVTGALLSRYYTGAPRAVLDVGCGSGINLLWLLRQFQPERVQGCDYSATALGWCQETIKAAPSKNVIPALNQGDIRYLPFADCSFDLVTSLDVVNLLPNGDDTKGLGELHRVLRPGGLAYVREPAYQWLMSSHDHIFETRRRYTTSELSKKMTSVGFQVVKTTYANTILFPLAALRRSLRKTIGLSSDKTDVQPWPKAFEWLNGPFTSCLYLEARWLAQGWRLPFGLSSISMGLKRK